MVASSGVSHSPAFRGYVDMSRDVELGANQLFDVDLGSESEVDDAVHFGLERAKPLGGQAGRFSKGIGVS